MLYPFTFQPILKERLWGGRELERLYAKPLPPNLPIGESWEISDRPGDVSVIARGPLAGKDLHWLVERHRPALLGSARLVSGRFPLLVKILDARETLSLQVHPPALVAARLKGDPKTEMWFIADAQPGSELFTGLRRGLSRAEFEEKLRTGTVAGCFHRVRVRAGDAMFVPSGRVHAIGAGCVIFEVQQNSDTTYRVFDWNRVGRDGKPRELHVAQSMESIDFDDFEPALIGSQFEGGPEAARRQLVEHESFAVEVQRLGTGASLDWTDQLTLILGVLEGRLHIVHPSEPVDLGPGQFCLIPASIASVQVTAPAAAQFLVIRPK